MEPDIYVVAGFGEAGEGDRFVSFGAFGELACRWFRAELKNVLRSEN